MASISNGEFIDLNAQRSLQRQHPNIVKLRSGVVRRTHPEPDREHVEGFIPTAPAPTPSEEPEPVAAKKKHERVDADTRAVAVARVDKLIAAGNPSGKAVASVAKEIGVSESAVVNWRTAARKNGAAKTAKPAKKKARRPRIEAQIAEHLNGGGELGPLDIALDLLELASRAKSALSAPSRKRLLAALTSRLS